MFGSCQYLSHVPLHNMAALVIDMVSFKEITYNEKNDVSNYG